MKTGHSMTRLWFLAIWLIPIFGILILSGLPIRTSAIILQQQTTPPPIKIENIRDNIFLIKGGSGANCYFLAGNKTNLLFDAKMTPNSMREMLAEIQKVSPRPLSIVILTHSDGDHVNGLPGLPEVVKIISHKNAFEEMLPAVEKTPELKKFLPSETYQDWRELDFEGIGLELRNFGPAHTSGDTVAIIPTSKVAIVGDLVFIGRDPLIHKHKNGSFYGLIKTLESLLAYKPEIELFLSGHADPVGREEVISLLNTLRQTEAQVREMIQQNKTLEEIKTAFGIQPTASPPRRPPLVEIIYQEIMEKK
jgi:glyoxylase-like metal-dependent hydrolase (beta-lactamase superfamily II)